MISLESVFIVCTIILIMGLCSQHYITKKKLNRVTAPYVESIRIAAEHSIMASNTGHPIISLVETVKAIQILEMLHYRYGSQNTGEMIGSDTGELYAIVRKQYDEIMDQIMVMCPQFSSKHPLAPIIHMNRPTNVPKTPYHNYYETDTEYEEGDDSCQQEEESNTPS